MTGGVTSLRRRVDRLDQRLVALLNQRAALTVRIARAKHRGGTPLFSPDREAAIFRQVAAKNHGPLSAEAVRAIYGEIVSASRSLGQMPTVAYLGPVATFSHVAALRRFGSQARYVEGETIADVFAEVERGHADYGIVPIENSTEGAVHHTLDLFVESELKICAEVVVEVSHHLLARGRMGAIRRVYSHPQVFGQCRQWLKAHLPGAELVGVASTSRGAALAARSARAAAIGGRLAAQQYGLRVLAQSIQDRAQNYTRFLVLGRAAASPAGRSKTSLMLAIKDRPGALHEVLVPFTRNRINLTKIESRPSRRRAWEYYFFVDLEGHAEERRVVRALRELEPRCTYLKLLGSYPLES